jgi:cytochrome c oxidase accessory protein FixG
VSIPTTRSRAKPRRPDLDTVYTINPDGSRNFLHPADVRGPWQRRKNLVYTVLLIVYLGLPWLLIDGRPAVHLDIPGRAAHLFGASFTTQDFHLVFFLLVGFGLTLFVVTSLWGRVWCGFACPQTVFMEGIFRKLERAIEGPRLDRIRRNLGPWTADKLWRKLLKHAVFLGLSWLFAHAFIAYFLPARELVQVVTGPPSAHWTAFLWGLAWTAILYFDYAWFREQTCLIICPYGRLQSTLVDQDTIVIGYDEQRGEPRHKGVDKGGDCVDCVRCIDVCPTGIDIRSGLQMECIGCANCIDACDEVMTRIGKPRGLIRYDSDRAFAGGGRVLLRARLLIYAAVLLGGLVIFVGMAGERQDFQVDVVRSQGLPFTLEGERIRNLYTLHLQNKNAAARTFLIAPAGDANAALGPDAVFIIPQASVSLAGLADRRLPLFVELPRAVYAGATDFHIMVSDSASGASLEVPLRFRGP